MVLWKLSMIVSVRTFFAIVFLTAVITSPLSVFAQNDAGITVVPATIEESADPGQVLHKSLTVTNVSSEDKEYYIYKKNIKGVEAGGVPIFAEEGAEPTSYDLSEWVSFTAERLVVPAGSSVELPLTIAVPADATPGSHFGGVFVSVEPPRLRESGAGVGYEVATIISIRISGDVIDSAQIRSFSTDKLIYSTKDVHFTARIENKGNILIRPRGLVEIRSMFSTKPEVFTVNDSLAGVFPGTTRDFTFDWKSEGIGFGKYEAVIALSYDGEGGQKTIDATHTFWVFPEMMMFIVVGVFGAIFALGYFFTQYYIRQAVMRAAGSRRIVSNRYRKQVGISRFAFVFISMLSVLVLLLIVMLLFLA